MNTDLDLHLRKYMQFENDVVIDKFIEALNQQYGTALLAIVFYGSCVRTKQYQDAVLDFYVVVNCYREAYNKISYSVLNKLLPPNVFFMQVNVNGQSYQAKYAVVSQADLDKNTGMRAFHPYFWARFAQPFKLIFSQSDAVSEWVLKIQKQAINTFLSKTSNSHNLSTQPRDIWVHGLTLTYATELRAESSNRPELIYTQNELYYSGIDCLLSIKKSHQFINQCLWLLRKVYGKFISMLRLLKALATFDNGVEYIAWKIQRHSKEEIEITPRLKKYPWLFCWPLIWRLYRSKKIH